MIWISANRQFKRQRISNKGGVAISVDTKKRQRTIKLLITSRNGKTPIKITRMIKLKNQTYKSWYKSSHYMNQLVVSRRDCTETFDNTKNI